MSATYRFSLPIASVRGEAGQCPKHVEPHPLHPAATTAAAAALAAIISLREIGIDVTTSRRSLGMLSKPHQPPVAGCALS